MFTLTGIVEDTDENITRIKIDIDTDHNIDVKYNTITIPTHRISNAYIKPNDPVEIITAIEVHNLLQLQPGVIKTIRIKETN